MCGHTCSYIKPPVDLRQRYGHFTTAQPPQTPAEHELVATSSTVVYANRWMAVREDQILRHDGTYGIYGVVQKPDFALIIPYADGGFHLVEQYRYPVRRRYCVATGLTAGEARLETGGSRTAQPVVQRD
ncbi:MAG TPA: hypothetical protein VN961_24600 [Streptosporangiaceae bacterium]|nr:hypothetical protein [Streptosporangiaceae bacterium]